MTDIAAGPATPPGVDISQGRTGRSEVQRATRYTVDLDDALGNWQFDYLHGVSLTARFDSFEEARRYVVEHLDAVVQGLSGIVEQVRVARSFADLDLCCCDLLAEKRGEDD